MPETYPRAPGIGGDPGALCTYAASCWDRVFRGYAIPETQKNALVRDGLKAVDRALALAPDHARAITCKVLLLRLRASLEQDPAARDALEREADACQRAARDARKAELIPRA